MSERTLLDVLEVCSCAAEAAHAGIHEDLCRVRIKLDDVEDAHILRDRLFHIAFVPPVLICWILDPCLHYIILKHYDKGFASLIEL